MDSSRVEIQQVVDNDTRADDEFRNVSLTTGHQTSNQPSTEQMNRNDIVHVGESSMAASRSSLSGQQKRRIAMTLVIVSVVVAVGIIIIIGMMLSFCLPT